ncbi:MFS transporter [Vibrio atlanticus]|uniref:Transmembrane transport proteins n=1 Tax=Vibrio atlanticus (strain LGP32) TaxID=575788 RepID=B7VTA7_VIBA3|nr:MFS transporter [Vibrio atlanticus]CAV27453.1 putative transmembrane transport proteins [Vibrio atlanticus]
MEGVNKEEATSSIWKSSSFIVLFSTAFFVAFGTKIYDLALPLLVYELTQSSEMMGWMRAVEFLPNLLLALFIGVWVDKFNKKHWSQCMLLGQVLVLVISYIAVRWLSNPLYALFPCAFLMMAFNYGYHNARIGMMKNVLPQYMQNTAIARMSSLYSLLETVGPVLSGGLLLLSALHNVFLLIAVMYVLAFWQLNKLEFKPAMPVAHQSVIRALKEGWLILYANKNMWHITLAVMVINTTGAVFWIQAIYFAKAELALNHMEVGYLIAASGIGGLLGSFTADKVRQRIGLGVLLMVSIALEAVGFIIPVLFIDGDQASGLLMSSFVGDGLFSLDGKWVLMGAFMWVSAIGVYSSICIWSYRQEAFDEQHLGRVAGITGSLFKLLMPFGLAASGYLVTVFDVPNIFVLCFIIQLFTALALLMTKVRHIE